MDVDKAVEVLAASPRHPSLHVHEMRNVKAKYREGGEGVFSAYASKNLRLTFEYGPLPSMIAFRDRGPHDSCEK